MISEEIIKVLEYLGEQMGVAIDWTSTNVWPQVEAFLYKYTTFNIINSIIHIIISLAVFIGCIFLWKHMKKSWDNDGWMKDSWSTVSIPGIFAILGSIVAFITSIALFFIQINHLIKWICIPELMILKEISYLMAS